MRIVLFFLSIILRREGKEEIIMDSFSEKSLHALGNYYVYGLMDPRTNQFFYIGKGTGNRVFEHERACLSNPNDDELKLKTIAEIKSLGLCVKKIILHSNLKEHEAFAAEAALINAFNYIGATALTNRVLGHHASEALSVEEFERQYGAEELTANDIRHRILVIKINQLYRKDIPARELYDAVRGFWKASMDRAQSVEYVFGVYHSLIVAVYKPTQWFKCKDKPQERPRPYEDLDSQKGRIFFVDDHFEQGMPLDENASFYLGKSLTGLEKIHQTQNPIGYLDPTGSVEALQ